MLFARPSTIAAASAALLALAPSALAQTFSKCNPLTTTCPADPALGTTKEIDFTQGASKDFTVSGGTVQYSSNGAAFTVAKQGDAPTITSSWYLMFGKVDVVMKAAPGTGIVSSAVLQSDDLDEVDWEFLGASPSQVQTNYFGKGITGSYNRGGFSSAPGSQTSYNTYTVEWTSSKITWSINGAAVRTLTPGQAGNQYPQSPMQIKIGIWAGGDPSNAAGTISWAGGQTTYDQPYTMYVKSITAEDYSTGKQYVYGDHSGSYQSIQAVDGSVNQGPSGTSDTVPVTSSATTGQPVPFEGTHADASSSYSLPSISPWVTSATGGSAAAATSIPGLPSGWTESSGIAVPSSSPATSTSPSSSSGSSASASGSAGSSSTSTGAVGPAGMTTSVAAAVTPTATPSTIQNSGAVASIRLPQNCLALSGVLAGILAFAL